MTDLHSPNPKPASVCNSSHILLSHLYNMKMQTTLNLLGPLSKLGEDAKSDVRLLRLLYIEISILLFHFRHLVYRH